MKLALNLILWCAVATAANCITIEGDRLLGRDFASANPAFATIPADAVIAPAPMPGVRRVINARELARLVATHGITGATLDDICFERTSERLSVDRLRPILEQAVLAKSAQIEILDFSRYALPKGNLVFPLSGLGRPTATAPTT